MFNLLTYFPKKSQTSTNLEMSLLEDGKVPAYVECAKIVLSNICKKFLENIDCKFVTETGGELKKKLKFRQKRRFYRNLVHLQVILEQIPKNIPANLNNMRCGTAKTCIIRT